MHTVIVNNFANLHFLAFGLFRLQDTCNVGYLTVSLLKNGFDTYTMIKYSAPFHKILKKSYVIRNLKHEV